MLKEATQTQAFQIGDTVIITATGQVGQIVAYESGRWKVKTQGAVLLKESSEIERRQALFG